MIRKRLVSMLSALALVLTLFTLLPESALKANAVTGSGTKESPAIVTNYEDLKTVLSSYYGDELYIKLGQNISIKDNLNDNEIRISRNVHLDLNGYELSRKPTNTTDKHIVWVQKGTLTIDDSKVGGKITGDLPGNISNLIYVQDPGTLVINGGTFTFDSPEHYDYGSVQKYRDTISQSGGTVIINGGTIKGHFFVMKGLAEPVARIYGGYINRFDHFGSPNVIFYGGEIHSIDYMYNYSKFIKTYVNSTSRVWADGKVLKPEEYSDIYNKPLTVEQPLGNIWDIQVPELAAGDNFPMPKVNTKGIKLQSYEWHHANDDTLTYVGEKVESGKEYTLQVTVIPQQYYYSSSKPNVNFNSTKPGTVKNYTESSLTATCNFIAVSKVTDVSVNINKPLAGATIGSKSKSYGYSPNVLVRTRDGVRYRDMFYWHDGTKYLGDSAVFEGGKNYYAYVKFKAAQNYELTENMNVTIEGVKAAKVSITTDENGQKWALYSAKFYCYNTGESYKNGDVNHDGSVDRIDANLLSRYVAGWDGYDEKIFMEVADLNGDKEINRIDANILSRCVADWDGYREKYIV